MLILGMQNDTPLPGRHTAAYEWIDAAGEIDELRGMNDQQAREYAVAASDNSDGVVSADAIEALHVHLSPVAL